MTKTEKSKHDMLLAWFKTILPSDKRSISEGDYEFELHYWWLFRDYPKFYSWGRFFRDHGQVGITQ